MFINRQSELEQLNHLYISNRAELFVLYGRRRVGKTELLRAFCQQKPHIFFIATLASDAEQLAVFSQQIYGFIHKEIPDGFTYPTWEAAFKALADFPMQPRPIVILDEFTYLISGNKSIPSIIQKVWDEILKNSNIMLILCGSYIGMMETEVLGYKAPLYGRRTASVLLSPLDLPSSAQFFPAYSHEHQFLVWAILGGMPYYLNMFNEQQSLFSNISRQILNPQTGTLFNEPRMLLMEELREPRNYFSILRAIAHGNTRLNEISNSSGIGEVTHTARYLDILQQMRLITRRIPATETQPEKSKKGIYQINDHFLRFWFRYVHPNHASLDLGLAEVVLNKRIYPDLDRYAATAFEEAAQLHVAKIASKDQLSFLPERIGGWWSRDNEIDVLAISFTDKIALIGECKWSINPVGENIYKGLIKKSLEVIDTNKIKKVEYALFARSGFTLAMQELASRDKVKLYTVDDLVTNN